NICPSPQRASLSLLIPIDTQFYTYDHSLLGFRISWDRTIRTPRWCTEWLSPVLRRCPPAAYQPLLNPQLFSTLGHTAIVDAGCPARYKGAGYFRLISASL